MKNKPQQVLKYGEVVWSNLDMDTLRPSECLCFNCEILGTCPVAAQLLEICKKNDLATMITRCKSYIGSEEK